MRLLLVNPSPVRGGAEELLLALVRRSRSLDITVACLADGAFTDDLEAAGARVVRLRAGRLRHAWMWTWTVLRLARLARAHDAVLSWQVKGHYYGTPAARLARRPVAWWDHGIRPARGEPRYRIDTLLPASLHADAVVCSSEAAAARHRRAVAILPGIEIGETASREGARALLGVSPDEPAVGIVGRLQPWKGQDVFLRAAARIAVSHPTARFFVIGGTPGGFSASFPAELRALASTLGIEDRVVFMGQRDDVPRILPGLDVFVMASFGEPFGLVTVEAMAAGVPVVATASGGTPEIVAPGTGLLVSAGDDVAIAVAVERYLSDPAFADATVTAARARAFDRFDISRYVRDVEDFVHRLGSSR